MGVHEIDDPLSCSLQRGCVGVDLRDPAKRLFRRRYVVALGSEDHDRILYPSQIGCAALAETHLAGFQLVADEEIFGNREDLLAAQRVKAVPPALEFQEPVALVVDVREEMDVFVPDRLFRLQVLEVLCKPRAVEATVAEVRDHVRGPSAPGKPAHHPHRVGSGFTGPVGERRAVQDNRTGKTLAVSRQERDRPPRLAVAVENGWMVRVTPGDFLDEAAQRMVNIGEGLPLFGFGKEYDEIDRVALVHRNAHLAVALEAADARAVAGARVDHDHRRPGHVDAIVPAIIADFGDPEERVVGGTVEVACVEKGFVLEIQKRRHSTPLVLDHVVGALAQRIQEQNPAFKQVLRIRRGGSGRFFDLRGLRVFSYRAALVGR